MELALLGKMTDREEARRTCRTVGTVRQARFERGIAYEWSKRRPWTAEEDRSLGTAPDKEIARRQGLKIPPWRPGG